MDRAAAGHGPRLAKVPLELWAFTVFAALVSAAAFVLTFVGPPWLRETVVPFTGWLASGGYLLSLPLCWCLIRRRELRCRTGIAAVLLLCILHGFVDLAILPGRASANPYLAYHPYRPFWTLVLPAVWLAVLYSPRIRRYCQPPDEEQPEGPSANPAPGLPLPERS